MTFDATPPAPQGPGPRGCADLSVCELTGTERFLVWAVRWECSLHDDSEFASDCLQESFERAGLGSVLPVFRNYISVVHGRRSPCSPASRLGCWRVNAVEANTLHALACLQAGRFGEAWRTLSGLCSRTGAARAMLALGEVAEELMAVGGSVRPWSDVTARL
jgi:hypothetical protein